MRDFILRTLRELGADLAGIADIGALRGGPSETLFPVMKDHSRDHFAEEITTGLPHGQVFWEEDARSVIVFAWTTIIGMYYTCEKSVNYAFGDTEANRRMMPVYMIYYMVPCVIFYNIQADTLWAFTDIISAAYVAITIFFIYAKHREIFRVFDDFWKRYLPAVERGEHPPYVSYDCAAQEAAPQE